jgi:hypothetical protein
MNFAASAHLTGRAIQNKRGRLPPGRAALDRILCVTAFLALEGDALRVRRKIPVAAKAAFPAMQFDALFETLYRHALALHRFLHKPRCLLALSLLIDHFVFAPLSFVI